MTCGTRLVCRDIVMSRPWHLAAITVLICAVFVGTFLAGRDYRNLEPPPKLTFRGLPISGSLADARGMGFNNCFQMNASEMRCRRGNVTFLGHGPYEAAIDLAGGDGRGGFSQVVLWHDRDQYAVYAIGNELEKLGWHYCSTYAKDRADQGIYRQSTGQRCATGSKMLRSSARNARLNARSSGHPPESCAGNKHLIRVTIGASKRSAAVPEGKNVRQLSSGAIDKLRRAWLIIAMGKVVSPQGVS
jgi:hypothetical protein